jgi:hypothetical protein
MRGARATWEALVSVRVRSETVRARAGSAHRDSTVPTVTDGRNGVKRKKLRGETTVTSNLDVSMFCANLTLAQPEPRTTIRSLSV